MNANAKKIVLFTGAAVMVAGSLVYILGVYPPAGSRDARGAIGQREVYRADQAKDAAVTPGEAPVVARTNAQQGRPGDQGAKLAQPDNDKGAKMAQPDK